MPELTLDEERLITRAGVADRSFADHSGNIQQGYELGSLTEGLVAYYPMEEGQGQVLHDGAINRVGQIDPSVPWTNESNIGSHSLDFDGDGNGVTFPNVSFDKNNATLSAWIKSTVDGIFLSANFNYYYLGAYDADGDSTGELAFYTADNDNNNDSIYTNTDVFDDTWHHIVGTKSGAGAGNMKLYIDGQPASTSIDLNQNADNFDRTTDMSIGYNMSNTGQDGITGNVEEVRIYDRVLSQPEIEALYNLGQPSGFLVKERDVPTYPEPAALARYEFEGDVTDSWGDFDGTDNTSAGYVDGVYSDAKDFDGSDDWVDISGASSAIGTHFTISVWVKTPNDNSYFVASDTSNYPYILLRSSSSTAEEELSIGDVNGNTVTVAGSSAINDSNWYHIVGIRDGDTFKVAKNGSVTNSITNSNIADDVNDDTLAIGAASDGTNNADITIDDVRIYSRALDPIEVETLFNKGAYRINRGEL